MPCCVRSPLTDTQDRCDIYSCSASLWVMTTSKQLTGKGTTHKDEGETHSNASPRITNNQSVCSGLEISTVSQPMDSDDTDAHSSGNDSVERESEGHMGWEASTCSSHNGKGSTTESKRYVIFKLLCVEELMDVVSILPSSPSFIHQFSSLQGSHLTTRPCACVHKVGSTWPSTPAGRLLSTPGAGRWLS